MADINPFHILREIESRFATGSRELPQREQTHQYWRGIGFTVLGRKRLAQLDQIDEILTLPPMTRVPLTQPWMLGVANVRGNLLPVIDMGGYLTGQATAESKDLRVLAVRDGELFFGLLVESVSGLESIDIENHCDASSAVRDALTDYSHAAYKVDGNVWLVVDLLRLSTDERFLQVAA